MEEHIKLCKTCSLRKPQRLQLTLRPIVANGFFSRVQVKVGGLNETNLYQDSIYFSFAISFVIQLAD